MAIPKFNEFFTPIMECLSDGCIHHTKEIRNYCVRYFQLNEADLLDMVPSGKVSRLNDRISWAKTYLKKAELIFVPSRSNYQLTDLGKKALEDGASAITLEYLEKYEPYLQFKYGISINSEDRSKVLPDMNIDRELEPKEIIESAISQVHNTLADNLMTQIMKMSAFDFEKLVVLLLKKIGYGEPTVTKKSGDEGIDGLVKADRFGFDVIYVQAKQWKLNSTVGRPDIQKFLGALAGQGAVKGLFITTAKFSNEAQSFAQRQLQQKIILVDGEELTKLMIEYDIGVSIETNYKLKRIDYDFFNEDL